MKSDDKIIAGILMVVLYAMRYLASGENRICIEHAYDYALRIYGLEVDDVWIGVDDV